MAKGKSRRSGTREPSDSLTLRVALPAPKMRPNLATQDLRSFDFDKASRPAKLFSGVAARVDVATPKKGTRSSKRVPAQLAFTAPRETLVCVRRARRKEVLHALRKTGKGGQRRPRRSPWSKIKC